MRDAPRELTSGWHRMTAAAAPSHAPVLTERALIAATHTNLARVLGSKARTRWARRPRPTITPRYTAEDRTSNPHSSPLR
jgi:hypothetical protein